jgi:hypothetical protein
VGAGLLPLGLEESRTSGALENFADTVARLGRTLEIVLGPNLLRNSRTLNKIIAQAMSGKCDLPLQESQIVHRI